MPGKKKKAGSSKSKTKKADARIPPIHSYTMDLTMLTDEEEEALIEVLEKDAVFTGVVDGKISELRNEILQIRQKGALIQGDKQHKICARCKYKFWSFLCPFGDHGKQCINCRFKVCKKCRTLQNNKTWICSLCLKQRQEKDLSGEWFNRGQCLGLYGSDLLRASMRDREFFKGLHHKKMKREIMDNAVLSMRRSTHERRRKDSEARRESRRKESLRRQSLREAREARKAAKKAEAGGGEAEDGGEAAEAAGAAGEAEGGEGEEGKKKKKKKKKGDKKKKKKKKSKTGNAEDGGGEETGGEPGSPGEGEGGDKKAKKKKKRGSKQKKGKKKSPNQKKKKKSKGGKKKKGKGDKKGKGEKKSKKKGKKKSDGKRDSTGKKKKGKDKSKGKKKKKNKNSNWNENDSNLWTCSESSKAVDVSIGDALQNKSLHAHCDQEHSLAKYRWSKSADDLLISEECTNEETSSDTDSHNLSSSSSISNWLRNIFRNKPPKKNTAVAKGTLVESSRVVDDCTSQKRTEQEGAQTVGGVIERNSQSDEVRDSYQHNWIHENGWPWWDANTEPMNLWKSAYNEETWLDDVNMERNIDVYSVVSKNKGISVDHQCKKSQACLSLFVKGISDQDVNVMTDLKPSAEITDLPSWKDGKNLNGCALEQNGAMGRSKSNLNLSVSAFSLSKIKTFFHSAKHQRGPKKSPGLTDVFQHSNRPRHVRKSEAQTDLLDHMFLNISKTTFEKQLKNRNISKNSEKDWSPQRRSKYTRCPSGPPNCLDIDRGLDPQLLTDELEEIVQLSGDNLSIPYEGGDMLDINLNFQPIARKEKSKKKKSGKRRAPGSSSSVSVNPGNDGNDGNDERKSNLGLEMINMAKNMKANSELGQAGQEGMVNFMNNDGFSLDGRKNTFGDNFGDFGDSFFLMDVTPKQVISRESQTDKKRRGRLSGFFCPFCRFSIEYGREF